MAKKYRNLINQILDEDNFREAYRKASLGKKSNVGYLEFKEQDAFYIHELIQSIKNRTYEVGQPREFWIHDPKPRPISAVPFKDRVVQHALVNIISPIFEQTMLPNSYACRKGKGTHVGVIKVQATMRRLTKNNEKLYALKTDFSKYFHSVNLSILWTRISAKISCRHTLWLIEQFTPKKGVGLLIGNLISQLWANVFGTIVDRFLSEVLKIQYWFRYMDDIVIFNKCPQILREKLRQLKDKITLIGLKFSKWNIRPIELGVNFLGFRIFRNYKLLRKDSVLRAKRKIKRYTLRQEFDKLTKFVASFLGHAKWSNSYNLLNYLQKEYSKCLQNTHKAVLTA